MNAATTNMKTASTGLKVGLAATGTLALTWAAPGAMAQGGAPAYDPFNSFSLGVGASVDIFNTVATDYSYLAPVSEYTDTLRGFGGFGTGEIGKDFRFGNLVLGIYGEYSFGHKSDSFSHSYTNGEDYNLTGSLRLGTEHSVTGRLGMIINPNTLIYGVFGYSWQSYTATVSLSSDNAYSNPSTYTQKGTLGGLTFGVGGEMMVTNDWSIKGEYRFTKLSAVPIFGWTDAAMFTDKVDDHVFRAVLSYKIR